MSRITYLLHSGEQPLEGFADSLTDCTYMWADSANLGKHKMPPVFKNGVFNHKYLFTYFFLDETSPWLKDVKLLMQLPAYRVLYSEGMDLPESILQVLQLRGAFKVKLEDLAPTLNHYFYDNDVGYRASIDEFEINPELQNQLTYYGDSYLNVAANFDDEWHYLGRLSYSVSVMKRHATTITIEMQTTGTAELKVEIKCFDSDNNLIDTFTKSGEQLKADNGTITITGIEGGFFYSIYYYVRGQGEVNVGTLHQRRSRGKYGFLDLGGQRLVDREALNGEIGYLFNPGNMQPPLTVYFAGYHSAETFEARAMLHSKGVPYLLISDLRVEGGTFYIGNQAIENKIMNVIRECLAKLHFTTDDLVLTGISMGTFASLYYGAVLSPGNIVIAKPLINLGTIAENLRINRPNEFHCATDMVLMLEGSDDHTACQKVDDIMWDRIKEGNFSNTDFVLGYMRNDDYDKFAYNELQEFLQKYYPDRHVISKGYYGRHNDDSATIAAWFEQQLFHILRSKYGQKF
ncbi:accessory Sec system protein Asp2 [Lactobacillus sp. ESL0731]|uniref:accessory Sec system protein Asp2 n=1 Tax=unclassified Lactobacillus TaxID=2620435 RepID=UPI0023F8AB6F|nr:MULTISPECIES: accessory Sec system protein Asp2 [unclassified Lactobacillus]WEV51822.1 accessory Sec system protein Asp2 [Lactobacillus sp. ESL0700]WEV62951.1 accessory Sec system protein Asp2 [Lactobacillus sp. ESL0731]